MLNIIVLGSGLIPRGYGIAPRKNPFQADLKLIKLLIDTNGLKPCFINPDTKAAVPLTAANCEKMYQIYGTEKKAKAVVKPIAAKTSAVNTVSTAPTSAVNTVSTQPTSVLKAEEVKTETTKVEDKKEDPIVINVNNKEEKKK